MTDQCYAQVRGSVIRVTKVDSCGNPDPGDAAVVVSKRVSTVTIDEVTDDGTNIRERNFADELCIVDDAFTEPRRLLLRERRGAVHHLRSPDPRRQRLGRRPVRRGPRRER
jgi:hypothetical protein